MSFSAVDLEQFLYTREKTSPVTLEGVYPFLSSDISFIPHEIDGYELKGQITIPLTQLGPQWANLGIDESADLVSIGLSSKYENFFFSFRSRLAQARMLFKAYPDTTTVDYSTNTINTYARINSFNHHPMTNVPREIKSGVMVYLDPNSRVTGDELLSRSGEFHTKGEVTCDNQNVFLPIQNIVLKDKPNDPNGMLDMTILLNDEVRYFERNEFNGIIGLEETEKFPHIPAGKYSIEIG